MGVVKSLNFENDVDDKDLTIPQISWYILATQAAQITLDEIETKQAAALVERITEINRD